MSAEREADAIYQNERVVARVLEPEIDEAGKELRFGEIYQSEDLLLPDECEFGKYIILVRRVLSATKVDKDSVGKGRILRGVVAEIKGYREQ